MQWRVGVPVLMLATMMVLAGCVQKEGKKEDGVPDDPALVAENAMKSFGSAASSQDGGDLRSISGSFQVKETDDEMAMFAGSDVAFDLLFEWGTSEVAYVLFSMKSGGMTMSFEAWCSTERGLFKWGDTVYESRPTIGDDDEALCDESAGAEEFEGGLDLFQEEEFEGLEIANIETRSDGSIHATFNDPDTNGTMQAKIDAKGRITELTIDNDEAEGTFEISYGAREAIKMPASDERMPASVSWSTSLVDGVMTLTITESVEAPRLEEFEAQVQTDDPETGATIVTASFPVHLSGPQNDAGYTFTYEDVDGDGRLTTNDTMTFSHPDWADAYWIDEDLDLYDKWAGRSVNESPLPAPGLVPLLILGLIGLAFVAQRRP